MMSTTTTIDLPEIKERCRAGLPGVSAHSKYAPEMAYGRHRGPVSRHAHTAAVIVALCETSKGLAIPLTVRSEKVGEHRGQVSLPGGRLESHESSWHAAVREFQEELNANPTSIELLTPLTSVYVYASNHEVQPFLAYYRSDAKFQPNEDEVSRLLMFPVADLRSGANLIVGTLQRGSCKYDAPGYKIEDQFVWGATALVLGEVAELLA
jgi:8-oxo-dGTP pyrophosphatase MutT (NUDIX family)